MAKVIRFDELPHESHSHEFVGADQEHAGFTVMRGHSQPGMGPRLHRHPYAEVFIVESGTATFQIGSETIEVAAGHVIVSPPGEAHGFRNTGEGELRLTAIHGAGSFTTEWLDGPDPVWTSKPEN
jgi:mannose-6-phosphate isomerase-like protein (cupin superfamily)